MNISLLAAAAAISLLTQSPLHADSFGTGGNTFTIDFVTIGNPGNGVDLGAGGGNYYSLYGAVSYLFRMGIFEISADQITKATNSGMTNVTADPWLGGKPATGLTWYEAAAFVNWLNTSTGHQAAYDLTYSGGSWSMIRWDGDQAWQLGGENLFRHKDAFYFLPSEDEWYKSAFHKNDGVTANYWDYATGSNSVPDGIDFPGDTAFDAVFSYGVPNPMDVTNVGVASPYGTYGQNGNVTEWMESAYLHPNNITRLNRVIRGGNSSNHEGSLRSSIRGTLDPAASASWIGFRVASIPEPSSAFLFLGALGMFLSKRRSL